jgi:hypothetical protein
VSRKDKLVIAIALFVFSALGIHAQGSAESAVIRLGDLNRAAVSLALPRMPEIRARVAGQVIVSVTVDLTTGKVVDANAISGDPLLRSPAVDAARRSVFKPPLSEFRSVFGVGRLIYRIKDFTGKVITRRRPKPLLTLFDMRESIINALAVKLEKPVYSEDARASCADGKVEILALYHYWSGKVLATKPISGDELLFAESENAVMRSKFRPAVIDGGFNADLYAIGKVVYNFDSYSKCLDLGIVNAKARRIPTPEIRDPNQRRVGTVKVKIVIDAASGLVKFARAVSGPATLREASEISARQAEFAPTLYTGPRLLVRAFLLFRYRADGSVKF